MKGRKAQVRRRMIERLDNHPEPPPLARLLRGGRGGAVRTKLLLSILWVAAGEGHDVRFPARAFASLIDLPKPDTDGARRILDAYSWLENRKLIAVQSRPGLASKVTLLEESGSGADYSIPGAVLKAAGKDASVDTLNAHRYITLPPAFWTKGWISVLSGPAVAMLLVLAVEQGGGSAAKELWFSPGMAKRRYDLSEDTRSAGVRELADAGLVTILKRNLDPDPFAPRRLRNVYKLDLDQLERDAAVYPAR
ncbi:hypothetical protein [Geodermatophilus poikilotrophus]|uniref:Uncharacterized protein n=1 Tax=Geodermatophilus poikilotrophus TaxID=1333667 RepID=A0A1I0I6Q6_9ACTN|nr:hypothetical protein [Geodermatophilus poikilotrophus]SET92218.1 hypothetical protein SAMN04488546_4248 [Geodermatophilus poikilotrophus]